MGYKRTIPKRIHISMGNKDCISVKQSSAAEDLNVQIQARTTIQESRQTSWDMKIQLQTMKCRM